MRTTRHLSATTTARGGRRPTVRAFGLLSLVLLLIGAAVLPATTASAAGGVPAVSTALDPDNGFPLWYEDSGGTRLEPCLDAADTNCVVLADAGFVPTQPLAFPTNFPSEFFYLVADSTKIATNGCSGGIKPGSVFMRAAIEGAFANGAPVPGQQMTFGRVRITATGLCANGSYVATTPFGQVSFTTNATGSLARTAGTTDIGCVPVATATCDWKLALDSPVAKSFLRWDPAVAPTAPAGYLGDAVTAHRITGATYTFPGEATPANYFRVTGTKLNNPLTTNTFTVSGKTAGPLSAAPRTVDLGGVDVGSTSATKTVTVTNVSATAITPDPATLTGANSGVFRIVNDGCAGAPLAVDATCQIGVAFAPAAVGPQTAALQVPYAGIRSPLSVALAGVGTTSTQLAVASASPTAVAFGDQRVRVPSDSQTVTVKNTGTAPLTVGTVALQGPDAAVFSTTFDTCSTKVVAVGSTCRVDVDFNPQAVGADSADLVVPSNDAASPLHIALTGTGFGGVAAVSPGTDPADGFPDWYQDERGVRLGQCIDPADPNCIVLAGGNYSGTGPVTFPDTFPDEFFYTVTDSDIITTPGCGSASPPGKALFRAAVEGAFVNGNPVPREQMTFGRIRFSVTSGLCPGQDYTFVHPYGTYTFTADAAGGIKRSLATDDVGCLGATATAPCDFSQALASRVFGGFLRWDPAVAPAAPAGYVGDGATLHKIVGAPYTRPGETAPANSVRLFQGDTLVGQTDQFSAMGRLAGPLVADPAIGDFGSVAQGSTATRTATLRNDGTTPLTITALAVTGAAAADFTVSADTCTGTVLAAAASCSVGVDFSPTAVGSRSAALRVTHTGLNSPFDVALHGIGQAAGGQAALSTNVSTLGFEQLAVGRHSVTQGVTVSNLGGSAPLVLDTPTVTGADAGDFAVTATTCDVEVPVDATCTVTVGFTPTAAGARTAALHLTATGSDPASVDVALGGRGFSGSSAVAATVGGGGFPQWYQDANGVRLALCDDPADPGCIVLGGDGYDPSQPISFPTNYPPELFYALADSSIVTTPGCNGSAPGTAQLRLALEAAFGTPTATPDQQITFGRVRFSASGLCPSTTYTFVTPYGPVTAVTDGNGAVTRNTSDIGCGGAPCAFGDALAAPMVDGFVRWAPGVGRAAPAGHLGDGISFHSIVGGTYAPGGTPVNSFEIVDPDGTSVAKTDQFLVSGRLASGITGDTTAAFGDHNLGTTTTRTLHYTNVGIDPVTLGSVALVGPNASQFAVTGGTCNGATLARDDTCTVDVSFVPTTAGDATAGLEVRDTSGAALATTALTGHGVAVAAPPRATLSPASLTFAGQRVGTTSTAQNVTVTNTGGQALSVTGATRTGTGAGAYTATPAAGCASVDPGSSCQVAVTFAPTATGTATATLTITSNDPAAATPVALTGTGTSSVITLKAASLNLGNTKVNRTTTKTMGVTNSGTAPLTISGLTSTDTTHFAVALGTCVGPIAPGRSCNISVTLLASPIGSYTTTVGFVSDATDSPTLRVTATVR